MKEESRPGKRRLPKRNNVSAVDVSTPYGRRDREHELDRAIISAVHRCERARAGKGYRFELPASLRREAA
jgi:hypothetical protein